jgi:hypothetical protein
VGVDATVTVEDIGNVLVYVAPGFFARIAYNARFPQPDPQEFYATVVSIGASLPIVAIADHFAGGWKWSEKATDVRYVVFLLAIGLVLGYVVAALRGSRLGRSAFRELGMAYAPEATIYEQTVMKLPLNSEVTVTFKDRRVVSGYPSIGPALIAEGQPRELYLSRPRWWSGTDWLDNDGMQGLIVSLDEVITVALPVDTARVAGPALWRRALRFVRKWLRRGGRVVWGRIRVGGRRLRHLRG